MPGFTGFNSWSYTLKFDLPSRLASAKNAMGGSVSIIPEYEAPALPTFTPGSAWDGIPVFQPSSPPGPSDTTFPRIVITTATNQGGVVDTWIYTIQAGPDNYLDDPGYPFDACTDAGCVLGQPKPGVGTFTVRAPQDVIGRTRQKVNWGLLTYKATPPLNDISCGRALIEHLVKIEDHIVPYDDHDVTALEGYLRLAADGGVTPAGATPTKAALEAALDDHRDTFAVDPLYACNRLYGTVLITDGLSNMCNDNRTGNEWFKDCTHSYDDGAICFAECVDGSGNPAADTLPCTSPNVPNPYYQRCCDIVQASAYDCFDPDPPAAINNNYTDFPPGPAESAWNLNLQRGTPLLPDPPLQVRTFVIGISSIVGPCELNRIAYRGRTDAALADFGLNPDPVGCGTGLNPPCENIHLPPNNFEFQTANHSNYAIFADDPSALADALTAIVDASSAGDYATNSPVAAAGGTGTDENLNFLASVDYPKWRGHFYLYNINALPTDPGYLRWDAGAVMVARESALATAGQRKIYTWDPADNSLVKIDYGQGARLSALAGVTINNSVIDFILGRDGTGTSAASPGAVRPWILGGSINSTPAVVGKPSRYSSLQVFPHLAFENAYGNRNTVVWVAADDGMMHAFSADDGREIAAILPPNLLKNQVSYLANYDANKRPTGQPRDFDRHIYGPANSMRFTDVYFPTALPEPTYKTVGLFTEGPSGRIIAGVDITHPTEGDLNYGRFDDVNTGEAIQILWTIDGSTASGALANLFETWSIPSVAPVTTDKWRMILGAGFNIASTKASPIAPKAFVLDPVDGSLQPSASPAPLDVVNDGSHTPFVGNQTFSDTVFIDTDAPSYYPDNKATLGMVPDLEGRIWFVSGTAPDFTNFEVGIDAAQFAGQAQPIYYPPATSGYGPRGTGCDLFTFGTGTFYEKSDEVTGAQIGDDADVYFQPSLFLAVKPKGVTPIDSSPGSPNLYRIRLREIDRPADDPKGPGKLGPHSQVVAPPFILVPQSGIGTSNALFLVFDPDNGCGGRSYIIQLPFTATSCEVQPLEPEVFSAGAGAASGFALTSSGTVVVAKSDRVQAHIFVPPIRALAPGGTPHLVPTWWRELK